jgi:hypothetical protein
MLKNEVFLAKSLSIARSSSKKLVEYNEKEIEMQHDALHKWRKVQE